MRLKLSDIRRRPNDRPSSHCEAVNGFFLISWIREPEIRCAEALGKQSSRNQAQTMQAKLRMKGNESKIRSWQGQFTGTLTSSFTSFFASAMIVKKWPPQIGLNTRSGPFSGFYKQKVNLQTLKCFSTCRRGKRLFVAPSFEVSVRMWLTLQITQTSAIASQQRVRSWRVLMELETKCPLLSESNIYVSWATLWILFFGMSTVWVRAHLRHWNVPCMQKRPTNWEKPWD